MNQETQHIVSMASFPHQQQELFFDHGFRHGEALTR
jgi:hypothetical protein